MAPSILDRIQAKIELFRLEQRYTRRRNRRSTFVSNAVYVDGEYIYQNSTGSSSGSGVSSRIDALHEVEPAPEVQAAPATEPSKKRLSRFSSMPGFGSLAGKHQTQSAQDWRMSRVTVNEVQR